MKVAAIQIYSRADKKKNISRACQFIKRAAKNKARFILLPEVFNYRGRIDKNKGLSAIAENIPGESSRPFFELAKETKTYILLGSVGEKIPRSKKAYNTSVLINPAGKVVAKYRKISLFDAVVDKKVLRESRHLAAGKKTVVACVDGFKLGMSICYDLRFSEIYRQYAKEKCHILSVPSAFTHQTGKAHWKVLLRARAIENLAFVIAPNQIGKDAKGVLAYGHSMIVSPWGEVLTEASGNKEEIIYAEVSLSYLKRKRQLLPGII